MDVWAKLKNLCIHLVLCEKYSYVIWCVGSWHYVGLFAMMLNCVRYVIFDLELWDFFVVSVICCVAQNHKQKHTKRFSCGHFNEIKLHVKLSIYA